jgi:hypothetical protein
MRQRTLQAKAKRFWRITKRRFRTAIASCRDCRNWLILQISQRLPRRYRNKILYHRTDPWFASSGASPYQHVNRCIYCRRTERLTNEHVVAINLGGDRVLFKACCEECRRKIHPVETHCLGSMRDIRYRRQIGTRDMENRPDTLAVWVMTNWDGKEQPSPPGLNPQQKWELHKLPQSQHPTSFGLPYFKEPGMIRGIDPPRCQDREAFVGVWFHQEPFETNKPSAMYVEWKLDHVLLARMIAKIAHCAAVWEHGIDNIQPFLPPFILGDDLSNPFYFVGGVPTKIPATTGDHFNIRTLLMGKRPPFTIVVDVRLFADLGAPVYRAVVGKHLADGIRGE